MRWFVLATLIGYLAVNAPAKDKLKAPEDYYQGALRGERAAFKRDLQTNTIEAPLQLSMKGNEIKWVSAFWAMELIRFKSDLTAAAIHTVLASPQQDFISLQRAALEAAYALYGQEFKPKVTSVADSTRSAKVFAMATLYLLRGDTGKQNCDACLARLQRRFPQWRSDPILWCLGEELREPRREQIKARPALIELLRHPLVGGKPVVFSIQRVNRDYTGLTVVRKPDGQFLRRADGSIFAIPHLARSLSNLPGYLTNGNAPQGILSILGVEGAEGEFIGPTPVLNMALPGEVTPYRFLHNTAIQDTVWTQARYASLLPSGWRDYAPMYEAFWAGQAGRTEIIAHGTTIDTEFYRHQPYYPFTPSLGCLTALEIWSGVDGRLLVSDEMALIEAYRAAGGGYGFFVLVEKDDRQEPVHLNEILPDLLKAEGRW